jgi:hypothetical protein
LTYAPIPPSIQPPKRKRRTGLIIFGAVVVAVIAFCGIGAALFSAMSKEVTPSVSAPKDAGSPEASDAPKAPNGTTKVGKALDFKGGALDGDSTVTVIKTEKATVDEFGLRAEAGQYLLVNVKIAVTEGTTYACGCNFKVIAADGRAYDESISSFKDKEFLSGAQLGAGEHITGWIAFEVPKTLQGARIQFKPNAYAGDAAGYWTL